jgi:uncharacterized protein YndB with AHSA1/START domain
MTTRSQTHATFALERVYPVPIERVWEAFADPEIKRQWFGSPEFIEIVPHERIVYTYDMWLDGVHASTSITTIVFEPSEDEGHPGTRLTFTEQGVHLDGVHGPGPQAAAGREAGTAGLLDAIGALLVAAVSKEAM